jgi:hypothetical protein
MTINWSEASSQARARNTHVATIFRDFRQHPDVPVLIFDEVQTRRSFFEQGDNLGTLPWLALLQTLEVPSHRGMEDMYAVPASRLCRRAEFTYELDLLGG